MLLVHKKKILEELKETRCNVNTCVKHFGLTLFTDFQDDKVHYRGRELLRL